MVRKAVFRDLPPKSRRTERAGDLLLLDGADDFFRVDTGGPAGVELGHNGRHAQRGIEQREDRQHRQVDLAGGDAIGVAHQPHLGVKHAVLVAHALGGAGGAGGEEDGGKVGGAAADRLRVEG